MIIFDEIFLNDTEISNLNSSLKEKIEELKNLKQKEEQLQSQNSNLESEMRNLQKENTFLKQESNTLRLQYQKKEEEIKELKQINEEWKQMHEMKNSESSSKQQYQIQHNYQQQLLTIGNEFIRTLELYQNQHRQTNLTIHEQKQSNFKMKSFYILISLLSLITIGIFFIVFIEK